MSIPKMPGYLLLVYVLICSVMVFIPHENGTKLVQVPQQPSEIGGKEDRQSRLEYEQEMLINPNTGEVPANIRKEELEFARGQYGEQLKRQFASGTEATAQTALLDWTSIGPENFGGRTRALAIDVRDENIVLAGGVTGGVWRSTDLGQTWTRRTAVDQIQSITAISQDIRNGNQDTWYYGTGELVGNSARAFGAPFRGDGVFKSTDNGLTWSLLPSTQSGGLGSFNSPFQYVWDITTDPNSSDDVVLAAIYGGIVRSSDGGSTWTTVLGRDLLNIPNGSDLNQISAPFYTDIHRTSAGVFYATLSSVTNDADNRIDELGGIYRSEDGINWTRIREFGTVFFRRTEIGSSFSNPDVAYFISDAVLQYRLFKYDHGSELIEERSNNLPIGLDPAVEAFDSQDSYDLYVKVHPQNEDVVYAGGTNIYRSTDGFATNDNVTWIGGYNPENFNDVYPNHHPDQHELVFLPSNPNRMLSANDGGIFITEDNLAEEVSYSSLNNGFITTQFYTANISKVPDQDFIFGGTQDNGSIVTFDEANPDNNGGRILGGDGGYAATTRFGFFYYLSFQNSQVYRLTFDNQFGLTSFARVDPTGGGLVSNQEYLFVNPYLLDPHNSNRMYLAGGNVIWRNKNIAQVPGGSQETTLVNWDVLDDTDILQGRISALAISTEPRNILYYGTSAGQIVKVDNAHSEIYTVTDISNSIIPEGGYISSIAVDPQDAQHIIVSVSNYEVPSIFESTDGGQTFVDISGSLEENSDGSGNGPSVRWISIVPRVGEENLIYAATSTGLYYSVGTNGNNTTWDLESPDGIGNTVVTMVDYRRSDGKVVAATHGRGLFTSQIPNVVPFDAGNTTSAFDFVGTYPNPFSDFTTIRVNSPDTRFTRIRIYDLQGALVRQVFAALTLPGENEFFWDGLDGTGAQAPDGVYVIRITFGNESQAKRVILQRE